MARKFYIESIPLVEDRISGVGHSLGHLVIALVKHKPDLEVNLVIPSGKKGMLSRWSGLERTKVKTLPFKPRIVNGLMKLRILPPMDSMLGRGVYLFGNFRNWPLTKKSISLTYIHDICYALHPEYVQPLNQKMLITSVPTFIGRSTRIITVSHASKKEICDYYALPDESVSVVYNGVDGRLYKEYSASEVSRVRQKHGIKKEYFIFVSNVEPRKNLANTITALCNLPQQIRSKHALLIIGGGGWLNDDVDKAMETAGRSDLTVYRPKEYVSDEDVAILTSGAKALLQMSFHEGFGMSPLQAQSSNTPVIVSDIPAHREVLGEAAIYADPYSIDSICSSVSNFLTMPENKVKSLCKKAKRNAASYHWERSCEQLLNICKEVDAGMLR